MKIAENTKILLVEDNQISRKVTALIFKHLKLKCDVASNGEEAFEMYKKLPYDLIFMDIQMPVIDGLEATKLIRNFEKSSGCRQNAIIIALTANEPEEFTGKYLEAGMDGFIEKPLRADQLAVFLSQLHDNPETKIPSA